MRLLIPFLVLFCLSNGTHPLSAQNRESVFSLGYSNEPKVFDYFSDGRWVVATVETPDNGGIFTQKLTLFFMDSLGVVTDTLDVPLLGVFEKYDLYKVKTLPDNSFFVYYGGGDCDVVGSYEYYLQAFDAFGTPKWDRAFDAFNSENLYSIDIAPDSSIICTGANSVRKFDTGTGALLSDVPFQYYNSSVLVPGTEDYVTYKNAKIEYHRKDTVGVGEYAYTVVNEIILPSQFQFAYIDLKNSPEGLIYASFYNNGNPQILKVDYNLDYVLWPAQANNYIYIIEPYKNGLFALDGQSRLLHYDTNGIVTVFDDMNKSLSLNGLRYSSKGLGVTGYYITGLISPDVPQRQQAWFRNIKDFGELDAPTNVDAQVTGVEQRSPIRDTVYYSQGPMPGNLHRFEGGNFRIQVSNAGTEPLQSFWINTAFRYAVNVFWCFPPQNKQVFYSGYNILPGESVWVDFGDVGAFNQVVFPDKFCFWTSGPNLKPDIDAENDVYCHQLVPTLEAGLVKLDFYPNPADESFDVRLGGTVASPGVFEVFNVLGELVQQVNFGSYSEVIHVPTGHLPSGTYLGKLGGQVLKLVVQH